MKIIKALVSGLAGACALTLVHETMRHTVPNAPRMDVLGMRAIAKGMRKAGQAPPPEEELHDIAMAGDILSNTLYYSLVGTGQNAWIKGVLLGAGAGIGAVALPGPLGLGNKPSARTQQTKAMAFGIYFLGGLVAAAVGHLLEDDN
jgi:hypothetical protein